MDTGARGNRREHVKGWPTGSRVVTLRSATFTKSSRPGKVSRVLVGVRQSVWPYAGDETDPERDGGEWHRSLLLQAGAAAVAGRAEDDVQVLDRLVDLSVTAALAVSSGCCGRWRVRQAPTSAGRSASVVTM